ncbi:hypothetical protein R6Q57_009214 [Mikania cordata]
MDIAQPTKRRSHGKNLNLYDNFLLLSHYIFFCSTTLIFNNITTPSTREALTKGSKRIVQTVIRIEKQSSKNILTKLEVQETGVAKHVEGWREMHCKGSSGWYNELAETHWGKIMDEENKSMSSPGGDDTLVNEVEILERSLGQRRGHIRGVGRIMKIVTPDVAPNCLFLFGLIYLSFVVEFGFGFVALNMDAEVPDLVLEAAREEAAGAATRHAARAAAGAAVGAAAGAEA